MFVMRTNKRRNLTSSQWAAIAVEAEEITTAIKEAVEVERRGKISIQQSENNSKSKEFQTVQLIEPSEKVPEKRTSSQWSDIVVEKEEKKIPAVQLIAPQVEDNSKLATAKIAETFNTNRTYISEAAKLDGLMSLTIHAL